MGAPLSLNSGAEVVVDSLQLTFGVGVAEGVGIRCSGSDLTIVSSEVRENDAEGIDANGCSIVVEDSIIADNERAGIRANNSEVFMSDASVTGNAFQGLLLTDSDVIASRNFIAENSAGGVRMNDCLFVLENNILVENGNQAVNPSNPAGGIYIEANQVVPVQTFNHNTVVDNRSPMVLQSAGLVCDTDAPVSGTGNIVWSNERPSSNLQVALNCDLEYSNVDGDYPGEGNIDAEPSFASPATLDYHLAAGSAGIDVADPASPTSDDIDGESRPKGPGFDMGADER